VYAGIVGDDAIRQYVESSDCIILLGVLMTDVNMGANTAVLDPDKMIRLSADHCSLVSSLTQFRALCSCRGFPEKNLLYMTGVLHLPPSGRGHLLSPFGRETYNCRPFLALNSFVNENTVLIADVGDAAMMSLDVTIQNPVVSCCPAYYSSLGFQYLPASGSRLHVLISGPLSSPVTGPSR